MENFILKPLSIPANITHLTGESNYTWLHYANGKRELFSKPISHYEHSLPSFIRIHKTVLVNLSFIEGIELPADKKQNGVMTLKGGIVLP